MTDALTVAIGRNIRAARTAAGLSQAALGAKLGVQQPTIGNWETGRRAVGIAELLALADVLGVSLASLVGLRPDAGSFGEGYRVGFAECRRRVLAAAELDAVPGPLPPSVPLSIGDAS